MPSARGWQTCFFAREAGTGGRARGTSSPRFVPGVTAADAPVLVVDTSALLEALVASPTDEALVRRLEEDSDLHAPHVLDLEVLQGLRGLVRGGKLSVDRAADARVDFADLTIVRYGHEALADRIWELRDNLTAYDAAFVVLAETLRAPLVTCDGRVADAPGHHATVELYSGAPSS